jgi:hypothetical protein
MYKQFIAEYSHLLIYVLIACLKAINNAIAAEVNESLKREYFPGETR